MTQKKWMGPRPLSPAASELGRAAAEELQRRNQAATQQVRSADSIKTALAARRAGLMPSQLKFLLDASQFKAAICTRRAGKTFVVTHTLAEAVMNNPWVDRGRSQPIIQFITTTRQKARDLMWVPFKALCQEIGIDAHWNDHELRADFPNGCLVRMGGADNQDDIGKQYRGDGYRLVCIDEPAAMGPKVESLIVEAIMPALMDYRAPLVVTGTPGEAQAGYFWKIYSGAVSGWSVHRWSYMDNVHFDAEVRTEEYITRTTGLPLSAPKVQREWFGNWVADTNSLVYHYSTEKNRYTGALPVGHDWRFLLGMDLGFHDPTAFVVGAYAKTHPGLFVCESEAFPHLLPSDIATHVQGLIGKYGKFARIVCDTGGSMARSNVEEWNRRYGFGMIGAKKAPNYKYDAIEHINSELALGRIKFHATTAEPLTEEMVQLVWAPADENYERTDYRREEHPGFPNHMCDAFLYMARESLHFRSKSPEPEPIPGTPDALRKQQLAAKVKSLRNNNGKFAYNKLKS